MDIKEYSGRPSTFCGRAIRDAAAMDAARTTVDIAMENVYIHGIHGISGPSQSRLRECLAGKPAADVQRTKGE